MVLEQLPGATILHFERGSGSSAASTIFGLGMIGLGLFMLIAGARAMFVASASRPMALLALAVALGVFLVAYNALVEPGGRRTVFDHASRTVTQSQTGLVGKELGPLSFDQIAGLYAREVFVNKHRRLVAQLAFADGAKWLLGYELLGLSGSAAASEIPAMLQKIRETMQIG